MGCRCGDIPKCSHDIGTIERIESSFKDADGKNEAVSSELHGLASQCFLTFFCKDMNGLETEEKKLNKTLSEILPDMIKECEEKVFSLRQELSSMISEDREYHEEQRRRERERSSHKNDDDD